MTPDQLRSAQRLTMANPERLRLLARVLTHPEGRSTADELARHGAARHGAGPHEDAPHVMDVADDLAAMAAVGLIAVVGPAPDDALPTGPLYRVSPRGIASFGAAALATARSADEPTLDVHDHDALLARLTETLSDRFADNASVATVDRLVRECYATLGKQIGSSGQLPALTAWLATDRLATMALVTLGSPRDVLFVCVHNTGRSQIAAAVTRRLAGDRVRVRTAGTRPVAEPDTLTETVLSRRGLDGLVEFPRELTDDVVRASGVIVTMGCGDACPVYPGRRYLDWPLDDPAGRPIEEVERIVDDVTARVRALVAEIDAADERAVAVVGARIGRAGLGETGLAGGRQGSTRGWLPRLAHGRPWSAVASALGVKGQRKAR